MTYPRNVRLLRYAYRGPKESFAHEESSYEAWMMLAVDRGTFSYQVGEEKGQAMFGDLVFCPPGVTLRRSAEQPLSFYSLVMQPENETQSGSDGALPDSMPVGKITITDLKRLASNFSYIRRCRLPTFRMRCDYLSHVASDMLFLCESEKERRRSVDDRLIRQAASYIRERFREPLLVQDVASRFGLSQSQFTRRFQAAVGVGPSEFITSLRLDAAFLLLAESDETIESVALQCGFQSGFYFSRVFTAHMRLSPSQYRKHHRL